MSTLTDLKAAAAEKLATVHQDVSAYVAALESKVTANRNISISIGVATLVALAAIVWIAHKL